MRDARLRLLAVTTLSVASFASVWGALAAVAWLGFFSPRNVLRSRLAAVLVAEAMVIIVSIAVQASGGSGIGYLIRFTAILLIALYAYASYVPGEILRLCIWLFGKRGFEPGLSADLGFQSLKLLGSDIRSSLIASRLKKAGPVWKWVAPLSLLLVVRALSRASEQADLLAIRGYQKGGSMCPEFTTTSQDVIAGTLSILIGFFAFIPVRDIFIALH